ncbi:putative AT-hook motif nuclear-localized protein 20 [Iris pallida]|uniref:AT-hook motif nuclear-localized protein 20 n=1 Tax=Iris pallida TaxID=29817 RepID=A0AAX6HDS0_IRIPA|nr:putative AT-hook motif nuclear-localized protein 20 [Iris pallida]
MRGCHLTRTKRDREATWQRRTGADCLGFPVGHWGRAVRPSDDAYVHPAAQSLGQRRAARTRSFSVGAVACSDSLLEEKA